MELRDLVRAGRTAEDSGWADTAARVGLVAYGLVHLLIAWLAIRLAFGEHSGKPSAKGALQELAQQPLGHVLLVVVAIGMFLLVVWRLLEAGFGHRDEDGAKRALTRLFSVGKAIIYGAIGVSALRVSLGDSGSSGGGTEGWTAKLMGLPGGVVLVGAVGLGIIGYGGFLIWRGLSGGFEEYLDAQGRSGESGTAYLWFGRVGYVGKGCAYLIVGVLFGYAALTHDPKRSGGLDHALHKLLQQPFGPVLLTLVAAGFGCYGLFCFARARHLSR